MALSKGAKIGIGIGVVAGIAVVAGVASGVASAKAPPSNPYVLRLTSSTVSGKVGLPVEFNVYLTDNGAHVSEATVTLMDLTTKTSSSTITDNQGLVIFAVTFSSPGTYSMQAVTVVKGTTIKSKLLSIQVTPLIP